MKKQILLMKKRANSTNQGLAQIKWNTTKKKMKIKTGLLLGPPQAPPWLIAPDQSLSLRLYASLMGDWSFRALSCSISCSILAWVSPNTVILVSRLASFWLITFNKKVGLMTLNLRSSTLSKVSSKSSMTWPDKP